MQQSAFGGTRLSLTDRLTGRASQTVEAPNGLVVLPDGNLQLERVTLTPTGIVGITTRAQWDRVADLIAPIDNALPWYVGDLIVSGETEAISVTRKQIGRRFRRQPHTLDNYAWVCRHIEISLRKDVLSYSHHAIVAQIDDPAKRKEWLEYAAANPMSVAKLQLAISNWKLGNESPAPSPLADVKHRKTFVRIWKMLEQGRAVERKDIEAMRKWLDALERKDK